MKMDILNTSKYKLNSEITESQLKNAGFRGNLYRSYIYGEQIQFVMEIDMEEGTWNYTVYDSLNNVPYAQYYNRGYGTNILIPELDKKIKNIIQKMQREKILLNKRRIK